MLGLLLFAIGFTKKCLCVFFFKTFSVNKNALICADRISEDANHLTECTLFERFFEILNSFSKIIIKKKSMAKYLRVTLATGAGKTLP